MAQRREPSVRIIATNLQEGKELRKSQILDEDASPEVETTRPKTSTKRNSISHPPNASNGSTKCETPGPRQRSVTSTRPSVSKRGSTAEVPSVAAAAPPSKGHKRKSLDDNAEEPPLKRVITDEEQTESDLSERGTTPECPSPLRQTISDAAVDASNRLNVASGELETEAPLTIGTTLDVNGSPARNAIDVAKNAPISPLETALSNPVGLSTENFSSSGPSGDVATDPVSNDLVPPAASSAVHGAVSTKTKSQTELSSPDPLALTPAAPSSVVPSLDSADHTLESSTEDLADSVNDKVADIPTAPASTSDSTNFTTHGVASKEQKNVRLKLKAPNPPAASRSVISPTVPPTPSSRPRRNVKQPLLFDGYVPTPEVAEEQHAEGGNEIDFASGSLTVQKLSRKVNSKQALSSEKVSEDDLANDVPLASKPSRKRKAETSERAPRKKPTPKTQSSGDSQVELKVRKTSASRKKNSAGSTAKTPISRKKAAQSLPSPESSPSEVLDVPGFIVDPELLELSKAMTHREPLASKPDPCGKPEVWAPGRQELCETLPYFKSAHSGCYSNGDAVYSFMFDSAGVGREYMDQDVIIARMGGSMKADPKTGVMYQEKHHDIYDKQPQSLLNNITHQNPLVIICGDKNVGAITKMPHRYCVLGWFKPTHVWAEMTAGKKDPIMTIRYRFERLDRSEPSWYAAAPSSVAERASTELTLPVQACIVCAKSCPQVYLIDWMCTNPECVDLWKLSDGQTAPYGNLDYHPAFLQHRTTWEREDPPFSLNPGVPQVDLHFGDDLAYVSTRGVVCPDCGRCSTRYLFSHWRCDTAGCRWKLTPQRQIMMPSNLGHTPWEMTCDGPSLIKATAVGAIHTEIKYFSNYKVVKYTIEGVEGSIIVAKANKHVTSESGGADDMFREMQEANFGLERRMIRKAADPTKASAEVKDPYTEPDLEPADADEVDALENAGDDPDDEFKGEVGARMNAFGMNFGMPYKFVANVESQSFEEAPAAIRAARARMNWAQRVFVDEKLGYQDFNEELVFGYLKSQKIKYHDDGEEGLGPRIATLSLGASAVMNLRVKGKYVSQVSKTGVFTYEKPLPLPLLESSGYASGYKKKAKRASEQHKVAPSEDTHAARHAAYSELQGLRQSGQSEAFRLRSKQIPKELGLHRRPGGDTVLSFHLTHGDIVIMEGEQIQKYLEHEVIPQGHLRFALTCRTILSHHLTADQLPSYEVKEDPEPYDGTAIREEGDGDAVVWQ